MYDGWENTYTIWKDGQSFKLTPFQGKEKDKGKSKVVFFETKDPLRPKDNKKNLFFDVEQGYGVEASRKKLLHVAKIVVLNDSESNQSEDGALEEKKIDVKVMGKANLSKEFGKLFISQQREIKQMEKILIGTMVFPILIFGKERKSNLEESLKFDDSVMKRTVQTRAVSLRSEFMD